MAASGPTQDFGDSCRGRLPTSYATAQALMP